MEDQKKLNIDVAEAISQLRAYLKQFEVKTKRYNFFFRGKSFDFDGYRPYTSDDDAAFIDWKTSFRSDKLMVKQYKEEQKLKFLFVIDVGENMVLGSKGKLKCECVAELVLSLSYLMTTLGHKVGYVLFSDKIKEYSIPLSGLSNFYVLSDILSNPKTYSGSSKVDKAFEFVLNNFDASLSSVILVSDFLSLNKKSMKHDIDLISNKYETFAFMVKDPIDRQLPDISGEFIVEDPNTGQQILVEPSLARKFYEKHALRQEAFVKESFKNSSIDLLDVSTTEPWTVKVSNFLKDRAENKVVR